MIAVVIVLFLATAPARATAATPTEQVEATVRSVLRILREQPAWEAQELKQAIGRRFDFEEMAKRSLGRHWRKLTAEQRQRFVTLFTNLLKNTYIDEIKAYNNEKVIFTSERRDGAYAVVQSQIVPRNSQPISVDYKLHMAGDEWKVYDVVVENVSLVNNYRSQFNRVLFNGTFEELIDRMKAVEQSESRNKEAA
ncbi:MAG TPA: ABC transporter substrate-binding protein [Candidatus Udaeobacter sp.]|nr:ABC transporter substrate-binding protein [Candidatus Udaeobacter sp.]